MLSKIICVVLKFLILSSVNSNSFIQANIYSRIFNNDTLAHADEDEEDETVNAFGAALFNRQNRNNTLK